jgi:methylthioxylose transferase
VGAAVWAGIVLLGLAWGTFVIRHDEGQGLGAAPFVGEWRSGLDERILLLLPGALLAGAVVVAGPRLAASVRWGLVPVLAGGVHAATAFLLAASDGLREVTRPLTTRHEYLSLVAEIRDPVVFLDTFVERAAGYPVHVMGHPPGAPLTFWLLDRIGLGGAGWAAAAVIVGGGMAVGCVLVSAKAVGGEATARAAAPFLAVAPAVLWVGTSADGLFSGVIAAGCTLVILAVCRPAGTAGDALALAGGAVLAVALHLTYGAVPLLAVPAVVAVARRRLRPLLVAAVGAGAVTAAFVVGGFWWFDGLVLTRGFYWEGIATRRPWPFSLLAGNPSVLALSVGPATAAGLAVLLAGAARREEGRWRPAGAALLPLSALAAVVVANASMLSKGEVERIWLPFTPWLVLAAAVVATDERRARRWLWPQVAVAVVLQLVLDSPW